MNPEELQGKVIGKLADLFAAVGNPIRLKTLYALRERNGSMKWQEIQDLTGTKGGALKFHTDKLEAFNLIESSGGEYRITSKGIGLLYLVDILRNRVEKTLKVELEQYNFKTFELP